MLTTFRLLARPFSFAAVPVLLGTAYLYGSPSRNFPDEYARVRAENVRVAHLAGAGLATMIRPLIVQCGCWLARCERIAHNLAPYFSETQR